MKQNLLKLTLAGLLMAAPPVESRGDDLRLIVEQVGSNSLPYQAVRLRMTLRNIGTEPSGALTWPSGSIAIKGIKRLGDEGFYAIRNTVLLTNETSAPGPHGRLIAKQRLVLHPGEEVSMTIAFSAEWGREPKPLFPLPGQYLIKFSYSAPRGIRVNPDPMTIEVSQPQGSDAIVYRMLAENPKLAAVLMSPFKLPDEATQDAIEEIATRFADSSYAAYARFALARGHLGCSFPTPWSSEVDRAAARAELEKNVLREFAYGPKSLVLLYKLVTADPAQTEAIRKKMEREAPDSMEWLDVLAQSLTAQQWRELRVRP